jgi:hypothetical protein
LCSHGSAGRQPRGIAWLFIATNAPGQPIAASHCRRSWRLSAPFRVSSFCRSGPSCGEEEHTTGYRVRCCTNAKAGEGLRRLEYGYSYLYWQNGQQAGGTRAWPRKPVRRYSTVAILLAESLCKGFTGAVAQMVT